MSHIPRGKKVETISSGAIFDNFNSLPFAKFPTLQEIWDRKITHPAFLKLFWSYNTKLAKNLNSYHTILYDYHSTFRALVDTAHALDPTRPVTTVYGPTNSGNDQTARKIFSSPI